MLVFIMVSQKLVQAMLSKVDSYFSVSLSQVVYQDNTTHPLNQNGYTYTFTAPYKGTFNIAMVWKGYREDGNYNNYEYYTISVNWIEKEKVNRAGATTINETKTYSLEKWDVLTVFTNQYYSSYNSKYMAYIQLTSFTITATVCYLEKKGSKDLLPKEVNIVWEKTAAILFWNLSNWEFRRDTPKNIPEINSTSYESTAFDITAYKGYLYIKLWSYTYKIPYTDRIQ